jgi:uncharacterized membrane protein
MSRWSDDPRKRRRRRFDLCMLAGAAAGLAMVRLRWAQHSTFMAQVQAQHATARGELAGEFVAVMVVTGVALFVAWSIWAASRRRRADRERQERGQAPAGRRSRRRYRSAA